MRKNDCEETINLILVGDHSVGKTSLMKRFTENIFSESIMGTVGIECFTKVHNIKGHYYYIKVWDTCGQERFRSLTANYYRNSDGIVLVFDISNPDTFDNLKNWIKSLHENTAENIPKIIVCNKIDLENIITQSQINSFSKEYNIQIYQSSAKANTNVVEPFDYIIKDVLNHKKNKNNRITLNASNEGSALGCNC